MTEKELRKQEIAKKMKELRVESGLTQLQVAEKLGITYQAVSNYERGKNSIETDLLVSMCNIYNVDPISVLYPDAKGEIYDVIYSEKSSLEEKCIAALGLLRIYFSRSIGQRDYRLDHPHFDDYVAMLLNQNQFKERFGEDVYNVLVQRYGKQPGIQEGHTSYKIEEKILRLRTPSKRTAPLYSSEAMKLAADYDELDEHGRRVIRIVADEELSRYDKELQVRAVELLKESQTEMEAAQDSVIAITIFSIPSQLHPMSAGTGQEADASYTENLRLIKQPPYGASYVARVSGDSMEPTYYDGDLVFIHSTVDIRKGQVGVFLMDGQQWIKELGNGVLISHNKAYPPRQMTPDIRCQGVVLGVCDESYFEK